MKYPYVTPRLSVVALIYTAITIVAATVSAQDTPDTTTPFAELIAGGLDEHPALAQRRADIKVELARMRGVGLRPDPTVSLSAEGIPWSAPSLSSSPMSGIQLGVSQPLWWPGELRALREQVQARASALEPLVDERQVDLVVQAAELYYELYTIDRTVEALEELKTPLREFTRLLRARIPTGDATVSQVERVRLELLRVDDKIFMLVHQRPEFVERLNAVLNRPAGSPVNPPSEEMVEQGDQTLDPLESLEGLVERGMRNRPMVEALERQKTAALVGAKAARWEEYPDVRVFGGWRFRAERDAGPAGGTANGTDFVSLGVSSTLPIWSGERAGAAEDVAQARVVSIDSSIAAFRLELRGEIAGHLAELHHLHRHVAYYRDEIIPQATQTRKAALAGFQAGRAQYEDWLGAEQRLVELRAKLARLEASISKHRALAVALTGVVPTLQSDWDAEIEQEVDSEQGEQPDDVELEDGEKG
jgi:outer membrane protein TolC